MGNVSSTLGYDVGFDEYFDLYKNEKIIEKRRRTSTDREQLLHEDREEIALPRAEDITDNLKPILERSDGDLFSFAWSIDPHMPLDPPETHREFLDERYAGPIDGSFESLPDELGPEDIERLQDLYDCEIQYTDEQFGKLVEELKESGEYEESLIIVLGDHGEAYYEHDHVFHGSCPHDEVLHVPLIIKPPATVAEAGDTVTEPVSLVDVCPTILDAVGIDPRVNHIQGETVPPFGTVKKDRSVFAETQIWDFKPAYYAVRNDQWKYIEIRRPSLQNVVKRMYEHRSELTNIKDMLKIVKDTVLADISDEPNRLLYDLTKDPEEQQDIIGVHPELEDELAAQLVDWLEECNRLNDEIRDAKDDDIDPETMEQLKQLGYAD